jgi:hypothetical protein
MPNRIYPSVIPPTRPQNKQKDIIKSSSGNDDGDASSDGSSDERSSKKSQSRDKRRSSRSSSVSISIEDDDGTSSDVSSLDERSSKKSQARDKRRSSRSSSDSESIEDDDTSSDVSSLDERSSKKSQARDKNRASRSSSDSESIDNDDDDDDASSDISSLDERSSKKSQARDKRRASRSSSGNDSTDDDDDNESTDVSNKSQNKRASISRSSIDSDASNYTLSIGESVKGSSTTLSLAQTYSIKEQKEFMKSCFNALIIALLKVKKPWAIKYIWNCDFSQYDPLLKPNMTSIVHQLDLLLNPSEKGIQESSNMLILLIKDMFVKNNQLSYGTNLREKILKRDICLVEVVMMLATLFKIDDVTHNAKEKTTGNSDFRLVSGKNSHLSNDGMELASVLFKKQDVWNCLVLNNSGEWWFYDFISSSSNKVNYDSHMKTYSSYITASVYAKPN